MKVSAGSNIILYEVNSKDLRKIVRAAKALFGLSAIIRVAGYFTIDGKYFDLSKGPTQVNIELTLKSKEYFALMIFEDSITYVKCTSIKVITIEPHVSQS